MKLYITESFNKKQLIKESLFFEYVNSDYDYDLTTKLIEILTTKSPIKLDSEYINDANDFNDATEQNIKQFAKDPTFVELKDDMEDLVNLIADEVEKIPGVEYTKVVRSSSVGLSTYLTVKFVEPNKEDKIVKQGMKTDPKFLHNYLHGSSEGGGGYAGEYKIKIRLSNHVVKYATDAGYIVDILGKTYAQFKDEVIALVKKHIQSLNNYLKDFARTGKISPKQIKRNQERKARKDKYNGKVTELLHTLTALTYLKESYGTEALYSKLDRDVQSLLQRYYINTEDIIDAIQVYFRELPMVFADLIRIAALCINSNIHNYIVDTDNFDLQAFLNDMETYIIKNYPTYFK